MRKELELYRKCTKYEACQAEKQRLEEFFAKLNARYAEEKPVRLEERLFRQFEDTK